MKAAVLKSLGEPLQVETVPDPSPEAAELVVSAMEEMGYDQVTADAETGLDRAPLPGLQWRCQRLDEYLVEIIHRPGAEADLKGGPHGYHGDSEIQPCPVVLYKEVVWRLSAREEALLEHCGPPA